MLAALLNILYGQPADAGSKARATLGGYNGRSIYQHPSAGEVYSQRERVVARFPQAASILDKAGADILAFTNFLTHVEHSRQCNSCHIRFRRDRSFGTPSFRASVRDSKATSLPELDEKATICKNRSENLSHRSGIEATMGTQFTSPGRPVRNQTPASVPEAFI